MRHSNISKYERDEVKPTVDVVKKLAYILNVTASFILGDSEEAGLFKDPVMLRRVKDISSLNEEDKNVSWLILTLF